MSEPILLKIDRNGSKHWQGMAQCDRCGGAGYYAVGMCNGKPVLSPLDDGVCWKCHGRGKVLETWIERTPEYQAKLDAKREEKRAAQQAKWEAEQAEREAEQARIEAQREAERKAREEAEAAERAKSNFVGTVGQKYTGRVTYVGSPYFERKCFGGYGTETCYIHTFKDADGNKIVWKTTSGISLDEGATVTITGSVKEHSEYREEKQTIVTRLKVAA